MPLDFNPTYLVQFHRDGFVHVPQFLRPDEVEEFNRRMDRIIFEVAPCLAPEEVFYEDLGKAWTLKQIQQVWKHDDWIAHHFLKGAFRTWAESLLQGLTIPKNLQYFNKPGGVGKATPAHQDGYYFMLKPCEAVTLWVALEDVDEDNGCVRYVPGSHHFGLREHRRTEVLGFSQGIVSYPTPEDLKLELPVPAKAGDLLIHHALTIHRADANQIPNRSRRALGGVYYSAEAMEDEEARAAYQQRLASEMKREGMI